MKVDVNEIFVLCDRSTWSSFTRLRKLFPAC